MFEFSACIVIRVAIGARVWEILVFRYAVVSCVYPVAVVSCVYPVAVLNAA